MTPIAVENGRPNIVGEQRLRKTAYATLITILVLSVIFPVKASTSATKAFVDDSLFVTYDFENLNSTFYNQVKVNTQFNISTIPNVIKRNLEQKNLKLVNWWPGPQTNIYDDANNAIHISFFLGGSDIVSFSINGTTMKRSYQVSTEWRKFQVNLTNDFRVDFGQYQDKRVADWQRPNATSFYYENKQTGTLDMTFYVVLPKSSSNVQVQEDTISYDMPPRFEDQLMNSPFLMLGAIAVALVIVLIYRKTR